MLSTFSIILTLFIGTTPIGVVHHTFHGSYGACVNQITQDKSRMIQQNPDIKVYGICSSEQ